MKPIYLTSAPVKRIVCIKLEQHTLQQQSRSIKRNTIVPSTGASIPQIAAH